jgi:hypothetical protein
MSLLDRLQDVEEGHQQVGGRYYTDQFSLFDHRQSAILCLMSSRLAFSAESRRLTVIGFSGHCARDQARLEKDPDALEGPAR